MNQAALAMLIGTIAMVGIASLVLFLLWPSKISAGEEWDAHFDKSLEADPGKKADGEE